MKKLVVLIFAILIIHNIASSQKEFKTDLQIPANPGMNIIGIQNAEITNPGNYAGLFASLVSPIVSQNGTIPSDLALEFSPYYLKSRDVTIRELNKADPFRDLKISIASNSVAAKDSGYFSRMGVGFRTNLTSGNISGLSKNKITLAVANDIETTINKINSRIYGSLDTADLEKFVQDISDKDVKKKVTNIIAANRKDSVALISKLILLRQEVEKLIEIDPSRWDNSLRTGNLLELAFAIAVDFPESTIGKSEINRWGIWLNYSFRPKKIEASFDLGAILRISNYSFDPTVLFDNKAVFGDFGGRLNWKIPKTKFSVSGEIIGKFGFSDFKASDQEDQYTFKSVTESKWNCTVGFQITQNTIWTVSLSDINGNSDYLRNNTAQFLMGLSTALVPMKK